MLPLFIRKIPEVLEGLVRQTKSLNERNGKLLAMHNDILSQIMGATQANQVYSPRYY